MKQLYLFFVLVFMMIKGIAFAQTIESYSNCSSDELKSRLLAIDPNFRSDEALFNQKYISAIKQRIARINFSPEATYTLPIVFHVITAGGPETLSDNDITKAVKRLNEGFRHQNGFISTNNPYEGVDAKIDFCLAQRDSSGKPTNGILRYNDSLFANPSSLLYFEQRIAQTEWNRKYYCNVFIISNAPDDLHFAGVYIPFVDAASIVRGYWSGELLSHELGHYLSLNHTFEGGCPNTACLTNGDGICDTPPQALPSFTGTCDKPGNSCATDGDDTAAHNPFRSQSLGGVGDHPDDSYNFMAYGGCWKAFTVDQVLRMRLYIENKRLPLTKTNNCQSALASSFLQISAIKQNQSVHLVWKVFQEGDIREYILERSFDGQGFSPLHSLFAHNVSGAERYELIDTNALVRNNHVFYRVQQIDINGANTYSAIVQVKAILSNGFITLSNTLVRDKLIFTYDYAHDVHADIRIYSLDGKVIVSRQMILPRNQSQVIVQGLSNMVPGYYYIQIISPDKIASFKVLKE